MKDNSYFIHPDDAAALDALKAIPGASAIAKGILDLGIERYYYGLNMATKIRLSPVQLPEIYNLLPPICHFLDIEEPDFYLEMNPIPNAYSLGDTHRFISITSGLLDMMTTDEVKAVIGHECGHLICRHTLYHTVAMAVLHLSGKMANISSMVEAINYALFYWNRKGELSCDRVGAYVAGTDAMVSALLRLAGGGMSLTKNVNLPEFIKQAEIYESLRVNDFWNRTLQMAAVSQVDHPFATVRVRELLHWTQSSPLMKSCQVKTSCPICHKPIHDSWKYCQHCGTKI